MYLVKTLIAAAVIANGTALAATPVQGQFKLHSDNGFVEAPECDLHTRLVLKQETNAFIAVLTDHVAPFCTLQIPLNPRVYAVKQVAVDECGSRIVQSIVGANDGLPDISIQDHRTRSCDDKLNDVAVELMTPNGVEFLSGKAVKVPASLINPALAAPGSGARRCIDDPACDPRP